MRLDHCPVCNSNNIEHYLSAIDHLVSGERFEIYSCNNCGLRFTNPRPEDDQLEGYYDSEEYISHTNEGTSLINTIYKIARTFTLRSKGRLVNKYSGNKRLLDIGCGTGHFTTHCQQQGWQVTGVEPNAVARKQAEENANVSIYQELGEITEKSFDVITLWHVLEHLPNLQQYIPKLKALLSPGGVILVAVPNFEAHEASVFKEHWAAYDVPRHLYHFSQSAIGYLTKKHGLKIVKTYPMWLDSFYISLLSNKYKSKRNRYLNSFITGLLSNVYATKSGNFSSLIYIINENEV